MVHVPGWVHVVLEPYSHLGLLVNCSLYHFLYYTEDPNSQSIVKMRPYPFSTALIFGPIGPIGPGLT